jgi:leader peptidase (prepilin peptidase)/N-methyltransferase
MLSAPAALVLIAAPVIGSFLGSLILRLPEHQPLLFARSACPHCGHRLGARELVPLLSWLVQSGRCRHCGGRISGFYPLIELAALAIAGSAVVLVPPEAVGWTCLLGWTLLALALIDRRAFLLPDILTLPLLAVGLAATAVLAPEELPGHVLGAAFGWGGFVAIAAAYRALRGRDGLGGGDAKLLAAGGAWLGWAALPAVVCAAAVFGLLEAGARALAGRAPAADEPIAFGTWLAVAIWTLWLAGVPMAGFGAL